MKLTECVWWCISCYILNLLANKTLNRIYVYCIPAPQRPSINAICELWPSHAVNLVVVYRYGSPINWCVLHPNLEWWTGSGTKSFIIPRSECGKFASRWSVHPVTLMVENRELGMFKIIGFGRRLVLSRHISQRAGYHVISKGTGEQTNSLRRFPFWR